MNEILFLSIEIYAFAIFISMLVAIMIKVIVGLFAAAQKTSEKTLSITPEIQPAAPQEVPVAAIAAAVCAVIGPHRIVNIKQASRGHHWKTEGRSAHHHSHNISRRR